MQRLRDGKIYGPQSVTKLVPGSANRPFNVNDLSGPQRALLREALLVAFTRGALDQMLQDNVQDGTDTYMRQ